jgi:hypothetical protein
MVQERARETIESAGHLAEESPEAWGEARHEPAPRGVTAALESVPSPAYFWGAMGAIVVSAMLTITGRVKWANFVGLWPSTILLLGIMGKIVRPSREM